MIDPPALSVASSCAFRFFIKEFLRVTLGACAFCFLLGLVLPALDQKQA